MFCPFALIERESVEPQSFGLSRKACTLFDKYARREEIRRLTSENASDKEKKDDAAYTYAKSVHFL